MSHASIDVSERGAAEPVRQLAGPSASPSPSDVLHALNHPLRRRILRALHQAGEARSPRELSETLCDPLSNVSYHVRVLRARGVVAETDRQAVRGAVQTFVCSVLDKNGTAVKLLESTAGEDGG